MNILNCTADQDREKARAETAKLEAVVDLCRAKKAANKTRETAPFIRCMSEQLATDAAAVRNAVQARLDAGKAALAAAEAKAHAKATAAALQPAAPATGASILDQFNALSGPTATAYYREHGRAIRAALAARNEDQRRIEHEMTIARASARNLRHLETNNR
jgi:hypothetical protein